MCMVRRCIMYWKKRKRSKRLQELFLTVHPSRCRPSVCLHSLFLVFSFSWSDPSATASYLLILLITHNRLVSCFPSEFFNTKSENLTYIRPLSFPLHYPRSLHFPTLPGFSLLWSVVRTHRLFSRFLFIFFTYYHRRVSLLRAPLLGHSFVYGKRDHPSEHGFKSPLERINIVGTEPEASCTPHTGCKPRFTHARNPQD